MSLHFGLLVHGSEFGRVLCTVPYYSTVPNLSVYQTKNVNYMSIQYQNHHTGVCESGPPACARSRSVVEVREGERSHQRQASKRDG